MDSVADVLAMASAQGYDDELQPLNADHADEPVDEATEVEAQRATSLDGNDLVQAAAVERNEEASAALVDAPPSDMVYLQQLQYEFNSEPKRMLRKRSQEVNYSQLLSGRRGARKRANASDDLSGGSEDEGGKKLRQKRPRGPGKVRKPDVAPHQLEVDISWQVGLNGHALSEEEEEFLPPDIDQNAYIKVRNHILARWRGDVNKYLTEEESGLQIASRYKHLVRLAWGFLDTYGFINVGSGPGLDVRPSEGGETREAVLVIGAGLAGVSAARQLHRWGYRVVILEGRNRPGGRVYTMRLEGGAHTGVADLGGSIVTGIDGNPLAIVARQLTIPMHDISGKCPIYVDGGSEADKHVDELVMKQYNDLLEKCDRYRDDMGQVADLLSLGTALDTLWQDVEKLGPDNPFCALQQQLLHWHLANAEFANAAQLSSLSLRHWDQDDPYEMEGPHVFLPGGNVRLVEAVLGEVPVFYNSVVKRVAYGGKRGVEVHTDSEVFHADAVVVTAPLGVLKRNTITFDPPLPQPKLDAIHRLGFGVLNKLVMLFPHVFWDDSCDTFGHVSGMCDPSERGLYYLFYQYSGLAGGAVLAALVAGEAAVRFEEMPTEEALSRVMRVLREIHRPRGIEVPDPVQACFTRWASDPMSCGSYSSISVGSLGADDYDAMAQSVDDRVFFAGEATIKKWPATMHGAYISGLREAAKISRMFEQQRKERGAAGHRPSSKKAGTAPRPRPAAGDKRGLGGEAEEEEAEAPSASSEEEEDSEEEYGLGAKHLRGAGPGRGRMRVPRVPSGPLVQATSEMVQTAAAVRQVFKQVEPDLEFGCFQVLHCPANWAELLGSSPQGQAILEEAGGELKLQDKALVQVEIGTMRGAPRGAARDARMSVHLSLSRSQVSALRDVRGGDEARVAMLTGDVMGVNLLGRQVRDVEVAALLRVLAAAHQTSVGQLARNYQQELARAGAAAAAAAAPLVTSPLKAAAPAAALPT